MKLRVFTLVYGEKHIRWFKEGLVRSLCWPRNRAAIESAVWDLFVPECDRDAVEQAAATVGIPIRFHDVEPEDMIDSMRVHAALCIKKGAAMLTAHPDNIFGDGSIEALRRIAAEDATLCVALAHPRVLPEFLHFMPDAPMSNPNMVEAAMMTLHPSFSSSDSSMLVTNTHHGGVAWRRLGDRIWGVTVNCPSIFLAQFRQDDLAHLSSPGAWDHTWPSALVGHGRQRLVGSSEAAFVVELTEKHQHGPVLSHERGYRHDLAHQRANRNTLVVWNGRIW